jgi:tetratricopeptide (TPR) repeat protein
MPLVYPAAVLGAAGAVQVPLLWARRSVALISYVALFVLGAVLSWGNWDGVRTESHRAVEFARLSNAAYHDAQPQRALEYANLAAADKADYPALPLLKGQALYALGKKAEAGAEFARSVEVLPGDPVAPYNLGIIQYYDNADTSASIASFSEALGRQPSYERAASMLVLAYLRARDGVRARQAANESNLLCGSKAPLHCQTACAALACAENRTDDAKAALRQVEEKYGRAGVESVLKDLALAGQACLQPNIEK